VLGAVDWSNVDVAGAFVLGAVLATIAVLRVVRAVSVMFGADLRRRRHRPPPDDD
jgi:hypothetical protein